MYSTFSSDYLGKSDESFSILTFVKFELQVLAIGQECLGIFGPAGPRRQPEDLALPDLVPISQAFFRLSEAFARKPILSNSVFLRVSIINFESTLGNASNSTL